MLTIKDIVLLLIIAIWAVAAIRAIIKARKAGKCIGCHMDCSTCSQAGLKKKADHKEEQHLKNK